MEDPAGATIVVPEGALDEATRIAITQTSAGAPALPVGVVARGPMFAFTPHGAAFAGPVTVTVPFDPAGVPGDAVLALYKTNAEQDEWIVLDDAALGEGSMRRRCQHSSFFVVASASNEPSPRLAVLRVPAGGRPRRAGDRAARAVGAS